MPEATFVFLLAESETELADRLRGRQSETDSSFNLKVEIARHELTRISEFDYCVVNRNGLIEETVDQIWQLSRRSGVGSAGSRLNFS